MWGQPHEHNTGGYNKQNNTPSFWGLWLRIKSDCALSCDLWSSEFFPVEPAHSGDEQAPGTQPTDLPLSSLKALEVARAHGRQLCQLLFVVQPVPAGEAAAAALPPVLLGLDSRLTCLYKQNTYHPQGVPS